MRVNPIKNASISWVFPNGRFGKRKLQPSRVTLKKLAIFKEGDVVVTPEDGQRVQMGKADLVTFPAGMSFKWEMKSDVKKRYGIVNC